MKIISEDTYSIGHLVLSYFGLAFVLMLRLFLLNLLCLQTLNIQHPSVLLFCFIITRNLIYYRLIAKASEHTNRIKIKVHEPVGSTDIKRKSQEVQGSINTNTSHDNLSMANQGEVDSYRHDDFEDELENDLSDDEYDLSGYYDDDEPSHNALHPLEKYSVKFSEDKNITIDITPRNLGHKVSELDTKHKKTEQERERELRLTLSVMSAGQLNGNSNCNVKVAEPNHEVSPNFTEEIHKSQKVVDKKNTQQKTKQTCESMVHKTEKAKCERRLASPERPKSALKTSSRSSTPVATVTVSYSDMEEVSDKKKMRKNKKLKEKDIVTMVQQTMLSDSEEEAEEDKKEEITPDKLEPWMPTKCISEPVKNYYEISRHASAMVMPVKVEKRDLHGQVYKTTKTLEFDELKPKETSIRSVIDNNQLLNAQNKEREKFVGLSESAISQLRNPQRPQSASLRRPVNQRIANDRARPASAKVK